VCLVGVMSKLKVLFWLPTVFFGQHLRIRQVEYLQTSRLKLDTEPPLDIYADGEPAGQTPAEFRMVPRALRVIVPE
ncbi:MAG TPA: hypothetical protein VE783_01590, partial [Candidatus Limnocylindrales bacterium]|nr:hypothetical protein [Candidatus Limnocylindrales bacterium]